MLGRESDSVVLSREGAVFFRIKKSGERSYVQIVENKREGAAVRQIVIANLGRTDELAASGALASLLASGAKLTDQVLLINALAEDVSGALSASAKRIGGPLLFGKIWERLGIGDVLSELLKDRSFEFAVERAVFVATLHRLFVSGSDRDCSVWMEDYDIAGAQGLGLHHFYRAMAWLGEEIDEKRADALAPRCVKDAIEEKLFEKRRDLFSDLSVVFMDTTSLSFYGEGGEMLGEHGYSKDYRPDLKQMILGLVVDGAGRPICTEMWPGNTADVTTLLPVIDRLRRRFSIGRVCVVADRGMISTATIEGLEARKLEYILGARERTDAIVRQIVLANNDPFVPLLVERKAGQTQLFVKQVTIEGKRYVVCRNEEEAEKDRKDRAAIVAALDEQLKKGDKGADRQLRLPALSAQGQRQGQTLIRNRRWQARRGGAVRRGLRAAHQCESNAIAGCAALSRFAAGRGPLPPHQGDHAHAADLSLLRRRHPRSRVLFLPGAFDAETSRRSRPRSGRHAGMEAAAARSRSAATGATRASRRRLAGAHRRRAECRGAVPRRSYRAPAAREASRAGEGRSAVAIRQEAPRPPQA